MNTRDILKNELKENHNNIITVMENHIMQMVVCDRHTANLVVNEVLELDRQAEDILSEWNSHFKTRREENYELICRII